MKPLIIGMGPSRFHPVDAWHPEAISTLNLCCLIFGDSTNLSRLDKHFNFINLNQNWHREEGSTGDSVRENEAIKTLQALIAAKELRGRRHVFLMGEQVTNFVINFLRKEECANASQGWRRMPKCVGQRLCTEDTDAKRGIAAGYYDFVAVPLWHPRTLTTRDVLMPPGWQQKMMNALRSAGGLPKMKFIATH